MLTELDCRLTTLLQAEYGDCNDLDNLGIELLAAALRRRLILHDLPSGEPLSYCQPRRGGHIDLYAPNGTGDAYVTLCRLGRSLCPHGAERLARAFLISPEDCMKTRSDHELSERHNCPITVVQQRRLDMEQIIPFGASVRYHALRREVLTAEGARPAGEVINELAHDLQRLGGRRRRFAFWQSMGWAMLLALICLRALEMFGAEVGLPIALVLGTAMLVHAMVETRG